MLVNGDKLVVTKKVASFLDEGSIVKVVDVDENGMISFAFGEDFMHKGLMNTSEFEEHFEKITDDEDVFDDPTVITPEYIEAIMEESDIVVHRMLDKCIVSCQLPNGYTIVESSSYVHYDNYDNEMDVDICLHKIADKIWELEAYRIQEELYREDMAVANCIANCEEADCEECFCDECPCADTYDDDYEEDECLDTDLDCDDCEDFDCPYNSNNNNR